MVKKIMIRLFRFVVIVLMAGLTFVCGYVLYTTIIESVKAFGPAVSKLWNFVSTNPVLVIIILACLFIASEIYSELAKMWKKRKAKNKQVKDKEQKPENA